MIKSLLLRKKYTPAAQPTGPKELTPLQELQQGACPPPPKEEKSILFVFDATYSRSGTWKDAQKWQLKMIREYSKHGASVGITTFGGNKINNLGWFKNPGAAQDLMSGIKCVTGGTRIIPAIEQGINSHKNKAPDAIVLVGDCFEEERYALGRLANGLLKEISVPVHAFHEGHDEEGEKAYRFIAKKTGGAFAKFGPKMPLKELVSALFVHIVKGEDAFQTLVKSGNKAARCLEEGGLKALPYNIV